MQYVHAIALLPRQEDTQAGNLTYVWPPLLAAPAAVPLATSRTVYGGFCSSRAFNVQTMSRSRSLTASVATQLLAATSNEEKDLLAHELSDEANPNSSAQLNSAFGIAPHLRISDMTSEQSLRVFAKNPSSQYFA
jgi:hypothetical protein